MIEIQYFDGDLEELDSDEWYDMDLEVAEPPEEERGPLDDDETTRRRDDNQDSEKASSDRDYRDELEGNPSRSNDEWDDDEDDDFDEDDDDEDDDEDEDDDWGRRGSSDDGYEE